MDARAREDLMARNAQEVVTREDLAVVAADLAQGRPRTGYIGFEPSGRVHLGWKVTADKVSDMVAAGLDFTILLADWHAQINDKLGGDLEAIKACGEYMKDCFAALGVPVEKIRFVYASDYVDDADYWATVIKVMKETSLARMRRAMDILGRSADEAEHDTSKFLYPAMQVADIFHHGFDVAYGGMDQRHAHMLCRDIAKKIDEKAPVAVHTPLIPSLEATGRMDPVESKMSKSRPDSGIFIHDSPQDVERKLKGAVCPQGEAEGNPVLQLVRHIVFEGHLKRGRDEAFVVQRPEKFGGPVEFVSYEALEKAFVARGLHPADLKTAAAAYVNQVLAPVAKHFDAHPKSLERMREMTATR
jgi:tyrosyl-tRNA synthetase